MSEEKKDALAPVLTIYVSQAIDKEAAEKALITLQKGYDGSLALLNEITEVTEENRASVVETLSTIKKYYDKIKATRTPITKFLDEMKTELMRYERPSDYNDKASIYNQKRALVEAFDEEVRKENEKKKQEAEREKRITVHLADVKAALQRHLVDYMAARKRLVIDNMAKWEKSLTLDNLEASEKKLVEREPKLNREDYDGRFVPPSFTISKINIIPTDQLKEMRQQATQQQMSQEQWDKFQADANDQQYKNFIEEVKREESYEKYNEEYVRMVSEIVNAMRARIPEIRKELQSSKDRQAEIDRRAEEAKTLVNEQVEQKLDEVSHEKDMNVMEAEFTQQAVTQDLAGGATEKIIRFDQKQLIRQLSEMIAHCLSHPEFPGIEKKGEYIPGIKVFITFYQRNCMAEHPIKGLIVTEKAKTTIKATS